MKFGNVHPLMQWILSEHAEAMLRVATPANPVTESDRVPGGDDLDETVEASGPHALSERDGS